MTGAQDMELVKEFARQNSEAAFTELVRRHIALVYSVAQRYTGNAADAKDVTQAVFIILARKAAGLRERTLLPGWLYETTRFTAARLLRTNSRRQQREQEAYVQSTLNEADRTDLWEKLSPHLEAAMSSLSECDRALLVLRFYQNKSGPEAAALMGIREGAAHMRVTRAIEKLRQFFAHRGVTLSGEAVVGALSANFIQAAPEALAKSVTAVAMAKGAAASIATLTLSKGVLRIMAWTNAKTAVVVGLGVLAVAGSVTTLLVHNPHLPKPQPIIAGQTEFPRASWGFAGYGDPQSALMSYLWASVCQSDRKIFEDSLTSSQKLVYERMIRMNMKVTQPHSEAQTVADTFNKANAQWQGGSYRIIDQKSVSENRVLFHVSAQMANQAMEVDWSMSRVGQEWKFDGIQKRTIIN
jgi:RNA polymerase sigma factor (sigma-70 family)